MTTPPGLWLPPGARYEEERAARVVTIFERILVHTKGRWARAPFLLEPWQRDEIIRPLFGTVRWDEELELWVRQYQLAWLELGRGNGKSELLAGIGLTLLCGDDEEGAEVYGAAKDRDQASLVYRVAARMVELSPTLSKRLRVIDSRKRIIDPKTGSFYEVIAADAAGNLGQNPHGILFDEVISQPNRELWDALKTGMGKRTQPLMVAATTAGNDPHGFAASEHAVCERVAAERELEPSRFVYMRNTPAEADWRDEANWRHANPALGRFLSIQTLRNEAKEAELNPAFENAFRQFRLNQWVSQTSRYMPLTVWDASAGLVVETELAGRKAYGGLDLASSVDLAALAWDFPDGEGGHEVLWRIWTPEDNVARLDKRTGGRASAWVRQGLIRTTPGNVIDYAAIRATLEADATTFDVVEVAFDRWGATQLSQELEDAGLTMIPMGQGFASMSPPTKEWERLVRQGTYRHGGNPVLRWMVNNVAVRLDPAGNVKIDKAKSGDNVDGCVAAVMALDRALRRTGKRSRSIYEERGMEAV